MTIGEESLANWLAGQSTNRVKLYRKAALSLYSLLMTGPFARAVSLPKSRSTAQQQAQTRLRRRERVGEPRLYMLEAPRYPAGEVSTLFEEQA